MLARLSGIEKDRGNRPASPGSGAENYQGMNWLMKPIGRETLSVMTVML